MQSEPTDLTGKLLIAMPAMNDPRFTGTVIYLCAHDKGGAMGLIVNKPQPDVRFSDLLEQLQITRADGQRDMRVHFGGPVEPARGFVLHSGDYTAGSGTMQVDDHVGMTATLDVVRDIAQGRGPATSMLALGYAGWAAGQLEGEIAANAWLTCDPRDDILFGRADAYKWTAALRSLGVDPVSLSSRAGHA